MNVNVGKLPEKLHPLTHQDMLNAKVKYGFSNQDTLEFTQDSRAIHGRDSAVSSHSWATSWCSRRTSRLVSWS